MSDTQSFFFSSSLWMNGVGAAVLEPSRDTTGHNTMTSRDVTWLAWVRPFDPAALPVRHYKKLASRRRPLTDQELAKAFSAVANDNLVLAKAGFEDYAAGIRAEESAS